MPNEPHDLTAARKNAKTEADAAAIAWAQDEIEKLRREKADLVNFIDTTALNMRRFAQSYDPRCCAGDSDDADR